MSSKQSFSIHLATCLHLRQSSSTLSWPQTRHVQSRLDPVSFSVGGSLNLVLDLPLHLFVQALLDAIAANDWKAYVELVDDGVTCFEPETKGHLAVGLGFHQFFL